MAAMAWNWPTALISAGIVCVLVAFIALLWHRYIYGVGRIEQYRNPMNREQRRYANDTNTIANCRCGCERIETSECAECYQPATGCSKCHRRISSPTVTRTNCQVGLDFEDCPCGSKTVRRLKCAKCCQPTIGCSECYRRLAPCVCDKPRQQCTYYPDPQMEGFGRDFAAMLGISNNRCATSSNLRSFEANDAIHRYTVQQQQEGDLERVNSQIEEYKKALRELDDVDNNQSKVKYWTTTNQSKEQQPITKTIANQSKVKYWTTSNQSKEQQPITRTIANQSKVQYWSDLLNGDRNIEKRHVQKFKVGSEVQRAKTLHSQKRNNREQPPRATVQESLEQTSADSLVTDLKEYLDFCRSAKCPPCPPSQESQEKNNAQNLVTEMKTRMKALVRSHRSTPCPPRPLGSGLNALREINDEEIGHTVKPTYHQPFTQVQERPHDLGKANAEIEHFRKALRELDEEDLANQPVQQHKDRDLVLINAEIADYTNALQVLNKAEMIQTAKRVQQRFEDFEQANTQIEEYRGALRELDKEDIANRPVQQ